jgi:predicted protein tyrosine phosphatase
MRKILFICTQNRVRSLTAEYAFQGRNGCITKSAGISKAARIELTIELIDWSDTIVFMDQNQLDYVKDAYSDNLTGKHLICLGIPDEYRYGEPELISELESKMKSHGF